MNPLNFQSIKNLPSLLLSLELQDYSSERKSHSPTNEELLTLKISPYAKSYALHKKESFCQDFRFEWKKYSFFTL